MTGRVSLSLQKKEVEKQEQIVSGFWRAFWSTSHQMQHQITSTAKLWRWFWKVTWLSQNDSNFEPVRFDRPRKCITRCSGVQNVARFKGHFRSHPVVYTLLCEVLLKTTIREARTDMKMLTSVLFWWQALSTFFLEVQQNGERIGLQFQSLQEDCTNKDLLLPKVYWNLENSIMETTSCLWFENTLNKNKKFDWKNFAHDVQAWSGLCVVQVGPIQQLSNCVSGHKNHN
jgi:hypothetical protein